MDLSFYRTMNYPIPEPKERFSYGEKHEKSPSTHYGKNRKTINATTQDFINTIHKHQNIYQAIPFATHIYICNSLSFNAVKPNSDIDLTIITQSKRLRTARLYSAIFFRVQGVKRSSKKHEKLFCLTFYLTHDHCNLYSIKRPHTDEYLTYRIAHSIPLHIRDGYDPDHLLNENSRIRSALPNLPQHTPIHIDDNLPYPEKKNRLRHIIEVLHYGRRGDLLEHIIHYLRLPIIRRKKQSNKKPDMIITSNTMLKFHHDKRDTIHDAIRLYKTKNKTG